MNNPLGSFATESSCCPYLGMLRDASTSLGYPSKANLCYQCRSLEAPGFEHQRTHCLTRKHELCPVFAGKSPAGLPQAVRLQDQAAYHTNKNFWIIVLVLGVISIGGVILWSQLTSGRDALPIPLASPTVQAGSIPAAALVRTATLTAGIPTLVDAVTGTPAQAELPPQASQTGPGTPHALDEPIGIAHRFVIHRMLQGESLFTLAARYNTSAEAIKSINLNMPDPVWVDWPVIIPLDTSDVSGLPMFEAYEEMEGGISLQELAQRLKRAVSDLGYYNGLEAGYLVSTGEWLLIPYTLQ